MEKKTLLNHFPLNIQLFADNGGEPNGGNGEGGGTPPITYTQEEYDKLKASFDKTSSELAKYKKEAKDKLSEEEKAKKLQEEKDQRLAELELRVLTGDMSSELLPLFGKDSTSKIIEAYKKGNMVELCKVITAEANNVILSKESEWKAKFQQGTPTPPAGKGIDDGISASVKNYVSKRNQSAIEEQRKALFK